MLDEIVLVPSVQPEITHWHLGHWWKLHNPPAREVSWTQSIYWIHVSTVGCLIIWWQCVPSNGDCILLFRLWWAVLKTLLLTHIHKVSVYAHKCTVESHADTECVKCLQGTTEASGNRSPVEKVNWYWKIQRPQLGLSQIYSKIFPKCYWEFLKIFTYYALHASHYAYIMFHCELSSM